MIENKIIHMDAHMLIANVLWVSELGKQVYSINYKHKLNTQHLKSIILIIKSLFIGMTTTIYFFFFFLNLKDILNSPYKRLFIK